MSFIKDIKYRYTQGAAINEREYKADKFRFKNGNEI
jgi:hypothetical protein